VTDPVAALGDVLEGVQISDAVLVAFEEDLLFIPPGGSGVDGTGIVDS
jgi:hypothetical protein